MDAVIAPEIDLQLIEAIAQSQSGHVVMSQKEEVELLAKYLALRMIV